ncbi:hypothetical protein B0H13DRAFT_2372101 [Mycena leptocephala]|nr:hypothetical protein B0H13DRAFT_2372101 [Mycena leptocephala]
MHDNHTSSNCGLRPQHPLFPGHAQRAASARQDTHVQYSPHITHAHLSTHTALYHVYLPLILAPAPSARAGVSTGGLGGLGFHETPLAGLGRKGGGARVGSLIVLGFSKAAMRSHSKPGLG